MASLHTLQHSCDENFWFDRCLTSLQENDAILLLEDAVSISCHLPSLMKLSQLSYDVAFFVLDLDLKSRGLSPQFDSSTPLTASEIIDLKAFVAFKRVSYQEFVELSLQFDKVVNWA